MVTSLAVMEARAKAEENHWLSDSLWDSHSKRIVLCYERLPAISYTGHNQSKRSSVLFQVIGLFSL